MALDGFTIGGSKTAAPAAPAAPVVSQGTALKGFNIGAPAPVKAAAAPAAPAATSTKTALPGFGPSPLSVFGKPDAQDTSKAFSSFTDFNKNNAPSLLSTKTETSTPEVMGAKASKNLDDGEKPLPNPLDLANDLVIKLPAELLSNTDFIKQSQEGIDAGSVSGNFAQNMLQKLSIGLQGLEGLTGGLYQAPAETKPQNPDLLDKGLSILSQGIGMATGIGLIGKGLSTTRAAVGAVDGLTTLANKFPLMAKYIAPYIQPLVENVAGFSVYGQLDPKLGSDIKARAMRLLTDVGTAPLYTVLGAIKNPALSLPASFGLGFGMAKLSGASNEDAAASGAAFAFLDAAGRAGGSRGLSPDEIHAKLTSEALDVLQPYSKNKLTTGSSLEDIKAAYYKAAHQTHPDVGGSAEAFNSAKNAFDLLSKGAVSSAPKQTTTAEKSIAYLKGSIKDTIEKYGEPVAHQAMIDHLGVDQPTADRLLLAAKTPTNDAEIKAASDKVLKDILGSRTDEQVSKDALTHTEKSLPQLTDQYIQTHGNFVGADEAKELMPGYSLDRSTSDLVQKAASKVSEAVFNKLLDTRQGKGNNVVLITAGGTGTGKSTALKGGGYSTKDYSVVFDTNLSNGPSAVTRINKALAKGYDVHIVFVYAPVKEAYGRVLGRTEQMAREQGSGRPVSAQGHIDMHHGSYEAIAEVVKAFEGKKRVMVDILDNTGKEPKLVENNLDFITNVRDNKEDETKLHKDLNEQRKAARNDGKISEQTDKAFERAEKLRPQKSNAGAPKESKAGDEKQNADVVKKSIDAIHEAYAAKPNAQQELDNMVAEPLDLSVAGFRSIHDETGEPYAESSTFPDWVPEDLRSMDLFRKVFGNVEKVTDLQYPSNPRAYRQRQLFDEILAALDYRLEVDTSKERSAILSAYGEESASGQTSSPVQAEVSATDSESAAGGEKTQEELTTSQKIDMMVEAGYDLDKLKRLDDKGINHAFRNAGLKQPGGFIDVGAAAEDVAAAVKHVTETLKAIEKARALTGTVRESIYQHENKRTANRQRLIQLAKSVDGLLDAQGWNHLYHFDENKDEALTPQEKQVYESIVVPLKQALSSTIAEYRELGGAVTPDLFFMQEGEYTPRFAKDKGSAIDKIIDAGKKKAKAIANGGLFSKSLGTVGKTRKFHIAIDENGERHVVYVPTDKNESVLKFEGGGISNMGPVKGMRTPKVKEYYDPAVREKLEDLAKTLGIKHERVATGKSEGLGRTVAGVSMTGRDLVKTRLSPDQVLAHEIGHQIDDKYGMQDFMKDDKYGSSHKSEIIEEMRALADKRFEGRKVPESFKKYVRKGSEKMAVMFEAYISNRRMFQETAPRLYDDFRDFLASHTELKPFLDIEGSVQLGSETHGNVQSGKIGRNFVDASGKKYTIGQATTKEIEANTNVRYHTNVLANYLVALDRSMNALSAMKLIERIKDENEFGEVIKKDNPDEASPEGWKTVSDVLPQFRGYHLEPRLAEALTDLASRQKGMLYLPVLDEVNNLLVAAIVLNPVMHVPNVLAGRGLAAAAEGLPANTLKNLRTAINEVRGTGPLYLTYLEHGAPFMALKATTKNFTDAILTQYTQEMEDNPSQWEEISKNLGYANPAALGRGIKHLNESMTWGSNDIFFMHALLDYKDTHGGTMEEAIRTVSKRMADYRIPERVFLPGAAGRAVSLAMQSRAFMFARFHYSGVIRPWIESVKETAGPGSSGKDRIAGARGLAYLFLMGLLVYPLLDKMWKGITGSPTSYMSMAGPVRPIQVTERLLQAGPEGIPQALQSVFSVAPVWRAMIELGFNVDLFQRNPIYGPPPAEGFGAYGTSIISPLASASRMTPEDFALSLFGVWTPKNVASKNTLNSMKYDELPALQVEVKKLIVEGKQDEADQKMAEFNTRAIATWNQYQLELGTTTQMVTTDAQKQEFLKEWGIKQPGAKALDNAALLYADGSLTSKSSLTDTVATYAKAFGVSPAAAFERIFTGQRILRVSNFSLFSDDSAIIVERMPLADSEAVKTSRGATSEQILDHVIPLEAGGSNDGGNLNLIDAAQNLGEQHTFENFLGSAVRQGLISQSKVREYAIRYKVGQGETLPDAYMKDFTGKYGGKTITLQEVEDAVNKGEAK